VCPCHPSPPDSFGTTDFCGPDFGPKHWLLVKEGIHIILDRILLKDNTHLTSKCPLYGRLSRVEKRAAVVRYASALVLRMPLNRNVIVDTISMCVYEACEQEALLEAPSAEPRRAKPRVPFMQKGAWCPVPCVFAHRRVRAWALKWIRVRLHGAGGGGGDRARPAVPCVGECARERVWCVGLGRGSSPFATPLPVAHAPLDPVAAAGGVRTGTPAPPCVFVRQSWEKPWRSCLGTMWTRTMWR
jgi:hypothetical protein